jgi:predicted CoA-binding protein
MDNTATYWVWDILLEMGFERMPVNPYPVKQTPSRKSDVIGCAVYSVPA